VLAVSTQQRRQFLPRPEKQQADASRLDSQSASDVAMRRALGVGKPQHLPLARFEAGQSPRQIGAPLCLGGDHTVALPLLRVTAEKFGKVALVHFDAHLDTWDTYFGAAYTHGTPFRRAAEEGLFAGDVSAHVGIRGPLFTPQDLVDDAGFGFTIVSAWDFEHRSAEEVAAQIAARVGDAPVYVSIDVDVMDPAHAPGTGTPEAGGLTSRELLATLRAMDGLDLVGGDIVEVAPAYDHAELTTVAASNVVYELLALFARKTGRR
jgi:agmatinase